LEHFVYERHKRVVLLLFGRVSKVDRADEETGYLLTSAARRCSKRII
jgi:hypothetical protein